ncbi:trypsin-like serine protease [Vibrio europaeus]|uniref:S1 family peptidase n=1 Tax=Vibrio europaeus TaxID=300876 RepID=UPI00233F286A|nr:trypsin-like serine protease [Vibrio europaeus]MDC5722786.1 trypsin-like serine protease [Vibrio europaeus]MDC5758478.1 trypsin-like serine protease [Vibrio europaeus]MDC5777525.1 trypsin-like serine protease [Vibrio europaeus]MDC5796609.1 trypsin-like serine protease [Vibrio europaeus]MDC5801321.1 trypsin-like serine protease [Vibrio europaeus]
MSRWSIPLALSCSGLITASALATEITPYIINGTNANQSDWPYITALVKKNQNAYDGQFCGASFIGQRYILTAAHCVEDFKPDEIDAVVGINNLNNASFEGARIAVNKIYTYDYYVASSNFGDVAVLELARDITSNEATAVVLADANTRNNTSDGTMLSVAGWGTTTPELGNATNPVQLKQLDVPLVNQSTCSSVYRDVTANTTSTNFCAGTSNEGFDSCRGDSGGPIVVKSSGRQLGIVSFGDEHCGKQGTYGVYANVSHYSDWIKKHSTGVSYDSKVFEGYATVGSNFRHTFLYKNYSENTVTFTSLGAPASTAIYSNTCNGLIGPGQGCEVSVDFNVHSYGAHSLHHSLQYVVNGVTDRVVSEVLVEGANVADTGLASTLSIPSASVYSNGNPWQVHSGNMLRSAPISNGDKSTLMFDGIAAGTYEFDVRLSAHSSDKLYLYVNGESKGGVTGERSFTHKFTLPKSSNRIKFEYVKDAALDAGEDAVYISNFRKASTTTSTTPATSSGGGGGGSLGLLSIGLLALVARRRK